MSVFSSFFPQPWVASRANIPVSVSAKFMNACSFNEDNARRIDWFRKKDA
jgi:hypothetical protein